MTVILSDTLQHHGILGMRWGVRRFQNNDGTLTPAGRRRADKRDSKWAHKNYEKIQSKAYKSSKRELDKYIENELFPKYNGQVARGRKVSKSYINDYNKKLASLMNVAVKDVTAPSGKVVQFVAKRGELGVHMALADRGYDMSQLKNGIWGSGRIAYKQKTVDMT